MLKYALVFLVAALIAGALGVSNISRRRARIAYGISALCLLASAVLFVMGIMAGQVVV